MERRQITATAAEDLTKRKEKTDSCRIIGNAALIETQTVPPYLWNPLIRHAVYTLLYCCFGRHPGHNVVISFWLATFRRTALIQAA